MAISCTAEYEAYPPHQEVVCWATVTLKAPYIPRVPVDIVAVIDKSRSMKGEKLSLVKKTLHIVVDQCRFTETYNVNKISHS